MIYSLPPAKHLGAYFVAGSIKLNQTGSNRCEFGLVCLTDTLQVVPEAAAVLAVEDGVCLVFCNVIRLAYPPQLSPFASWSSAAMTGPA